MLWDHGWTDWTWPQSDRGPEKSNDSIAEAAFRRGFSSSHDSISIHWGALRPQAQIMMRFEGSENSSQARFSLGKSSEASSQLAE